MNDSANGLAKGLLIFGVIIIIGLIAGSVDSKPKCIKSGCSNDQASGSSYCYLHKPYTGSSSYSNKSSGSSSYSSGSSSKSSTSSSSSKKTTSSYSSKSYSTNKKVEMPDCDDYEDFDDFMDDWDGYMPDGSDAEDYWDNW
ncbi:hypothetical protein [Bacteroides acidifaciens]|jgi:hypothetical protein|uniref:hypothetical protein n=1 Tax=Bacteroides acidifaciens TaxID=85831 RepID=UPI002557D3BB|nr:hypothetical protein [Bacteroides acidifaciens]